METSLSKALRDLGFVYTPQEEYKGIVTEEEIGLLKKFKDWFEDVSEAVFERCMFLSEAKQIFDQSSVVYSKGMVNSTTYVSFLYQNFEAKEECCLYFDHSPYHLCHIRFYVGHVHKGITYFSLVGEAGGNVPTKVPQEIHYLLFAYLRNLFSCSIMPDLPSILERRRKIKDAIMSTNYAIKGMLENKNFSDIFNEPIGRLLTSKDIRETIDWEITHCQNSELTTFYKELKEELNKRGIK